MSKYAPLGDYLRQQGTDLVPITFAEIEHILGFALPHSKSYRAWWSNNDFNNVMTKVWLDAGYRTEAVDMEAGTLVFRRQAADGASPKIRQDQPVRDDSTAKKESKRHPLFGRLSGLLNISPETDLTTPADEEWGQSI